MMILADVPRSLASRAAMAFVLGVSCFLGASCSSSEADTGPSEVRDTTGQVWTSWKAAVAGAKVYLVPADQIPTTPITVSGVLDRSAEAYDEPLEDLVRSSLASSFPQAITDADGKFKLVQLDTTRKYYPYVDVTGAMPDGLLPGGSLSRVAHGGASLDNLQIELTGHPTAAATYMGSSVCLKCHQDFAAMKTHAHRLGFRKPNTSTKLQDLSLKPGFDAGLAFFKNATNATFKTAGTALWYYGYDASRDFDKFRIATSDPTNAEIKVYLWRDASNGGYRISMENLVNSEADRTFVVELTYGGALYKQRYMLQVPGSGQEGRYPFLQYQHTGDNTYYERTRQVWRDYHMDSFWDATAKTFKNPDKSQVIESRCMACHATGYRYFDHPTTGERLCDAVNDGAGAIDIDGDGKLDEVNIGCEVCHGPGSEHVATQSKQFILKPELLSPERENMLCGRCHDRQLGADDLANGQPLNVNGEMAMPGVSRKDFLDNYVSRRGPELSDFWDDGIHSKAHQQQYSDFLKSKHYRNSRRLVVCSDCHDSHGMGAYQGRMTGDPTDGTLCATCHALESASDHLLEKTGSRKTVSARACINCHFYKTAKTGAGRRGILLGIPTGNPSDANITYWQNDISSHLTVVPHKTDVGVRGKVPGEAMPAPYVNACGTCHDARFLQYQK